MTHWQQAMPSLSGECKHQQKLDSQALRRQYKSLSHVTGSISMPRRTILMTMIASLSILCSTTSVIAAETQQGASEMEPAGKVLTVRGTLKAVAQDNSERVLERRSQFYETDVLVTDEKSHAQIRFTDDSIMALKPNTEFKIAGYHYNAAEPQNGKQVGRLLKGGFRALTGKIADANPKNYRIDTPVATIGIRGTNYSAILVGESLSVAVWQGSIRLTNQAGSLDLGDGYSMRYGQINSKNEDPQGLIEAPPELDQDCTFYHHKR